MHIDTDVYLYESVDRCDKAKAASKVRENLIKAGKSHRIASTKALCKCITMLYRTLATLGPSIYLTVTGSRQCQMSVNLSLGRAINKHKFATCLSGERERERDSRDPNRINELISIRSGFWVR